MISDIRDNTCAVTDIASAPPCICTCSCNCGCYNDDGVVLRIQERIEEKADLRVFIRG